MLFSYFERDFLAPCNWMLSQLSNRLGNTGQSTRLSKVRGSWFLEATDFCHLQACQIHRCIFAPVTSVNAHYYSVLTTPFDMVNAHYFIIDFHAKFFIKIQNQVSDTSRSLPSFSNAPFLLCAVPSERLGSRFYQKRLTVRFRLQIYN